VNLVLFMMTCSTFPWQPSGNIACTRDTTPVYRRCYSPRAMVKPWKHQRSIVAVWCRNW